MKIPYKIIRSNRRTISITITKQAEVIVRAPIFCDEKRIQDFLTKKQNWIITKINEIKQNAKTLILNNNEQIDILGETYSIKLTDKSTVKLVPPNLNLPSEDTKVKLVSYLKRLAHKYLSARVEELAKVYNFTYKSIKITSAKTRWGSCSADNALNFTYKLMLCPKSVVDYIIIHELSHTRVKNHSKRFYSQVAKIMPEYKLAEKWLKQNSGIIELI